MSTGKGRSSIGSKIAFSAAAPATHDQAGFEALTWVEWLEATEIGEFGASVDQSDYVPVHSGVKHKIASVVDNGDQSISGAYDSSNPAQQLLRAASKTTSKSISVRETLPDGDVYYYTAILQGPKIGAATATGGVQMISATLGISGEVVDVIA